MYCETQEEKIDIYPLRQYIYIHFLSTIKLHLLICVITQKIE